MSQSNNRSKYSLLNAIAAMSLTLANGLLGIVVTRLLLAYFGSDFNGLNSTANQVVHVLMIVEGGFTTASNVALFRPMVMEEYTAVNGILSATKRKFRKIGSTFFLIGTLVAIVYAMLANSGLPRDFIATVIMMTMIPPAFNLYYATTYRVILQAQQKEYIISFTTAATISLGHLCNIGMILLGGPIWMVRVNTMVFALLNSVLIAGYVKRKNPYVDLQAEPRGDLIKGTNDVMAQRITSVIYDSSPLIFLSISPVGGTVLASVYAVYNNVFIIIKSLIRGAIDAPRLSFGQILAQRKRENVWHLFAQYEYAAFCAVFVLLTTTCALILPFVGIYTDGITDAQYNDVNIAVMMALIATAELIHMPSSHLLNMAGEFKVCRNIQIITCIVLLAGMMIGGTMWGLYGMMLALLGATILLDILEMGYVHLRFFQKKAAKLLSLLLPMTLVGTLMCYAELNLNLHVDNYVSFIGYGILFVTVNGLAALLTGLVFNRTELTSVFRHVKRLILRK